MPVRLEGWGGDRPVAGRVRLVEPAAATRVSALGVEEQRVNVIVDVVDPPAALGDGFRLDARIVVWEGEDVLTVPASALVRAAGAAGAAGAAAGGGWAVYLVENGRATLREVRVGRMGGAAAQVLGGLRAGDRVVVFPSDKLQPGARVATR